MPAGGMRLGRTDSLGTRLAALLTLAILPLGLITVFQTYRVLDEAAGRIEAALLGETLRATRAERGAIQAGIGSAEALASALPDLLADPDACRAFLREFVARSNTALFAGVVPLDGLMVCASEGAAVDFSDSSILQEALDDPRVFIRVTEEGAVTGRPSTLVSAPITTDEGAMIGYVILSYPLSHLDPTVAAEAGFQPLDLVSFNVQGDILTYSGDAEVTRSLMPRNRSLKALAGAQSVVFREESIGGDTLIYTVTPLIEGAVYAMAIWPIALAPGANGWLRWTIPTVILPFLMWITSLSVAYFAVHRLVIRHIRRLRQRMRLFSRFRRVEEHPEDEDLPLELREVSESFLTMAHTIQREEAELENSLREKDALLREVYHRVRNNLQLIASMNNMQMRSSTSPEALYALRRLQDRIMALSTIHATLYQAPALAKVRADEMVLTLARQVAAKADSGAVIDVRAQSAPILLYPDQAVPLSLLVVEAVTNAVKHLGRPVQDRPPYLEVTLAEEDAMITLRVENSVGSDPQEADVQAPGGRLGMQLMKAFVIQLGADLKIEEADQSYRLTVAFHPSEYGEETAIY